MMDILLVIIAGILLVSGLVFFFGTVVGCCGFLPFTRACMPPARRILFRLY